MIEDNKWTPFRIRWEDGVFTTFIDNEKGVEVRIPKSVDAPHIGLQGKTKGEVAYRNLRARPLGSEAATRSRPSPAGSQYQTSTANRNTTDTGIPGIYLEEFDLEGLEKRTPTIREEFDEEKQNATGAIIQKAGILSWDHPNAGFHANTQCRLQTGILEVTGRVTSGEDSAWIICLHSRQSMKGVQLAVRADGKIVRTSSMFQKANKIPPTVIHSLNKADASEFQTLGILAEGDRVRFFLNGSPISETIPLGFDLEEWDLNLGVSGIGKVEFDRYLFWRK